MYVYSLALKIYTYIMYMYTLQYMLASVVTLPFNRTPQLLPTNCNLIITNQPFPSLPPAYSPQPLVSTIVLCCEINFSDTSYN